MRNVIIRCLALFLISLGSLHAAQEIMEGLTYTPIAYEKPLQSIHILTADPRYIEIAIGIADNQCAAAQTTSVIAQQQGAVAAVNGSFFDFGCANRIEDAFLKLLDSIGCFNYYAYPVWTLVSDKRHYSLTSSKLPFFTGAIAWNSTDQKPAFSAIKSHLHVSINTATIPIEVFNKPFQKGIALFSPTFGKATPEFLDPVDEIIIDDDHVVAIIPASYGKTAIPTNGAILALNAENHALRETIHCGDSVNMTIFHEQKPELAAVCDEPFWRGAENIVASTPLLVLQSEIPDYLYTRTSSFYTKRHPRTAVGILENGTWVFVVVEGRNSHSDGLTIIELAECMKALGCVNALNLDGGDSSTMVIHNRVVSEPTGYFLSRKEQPVSHAIVLKPRKLTDSSVDSQ